MTDSFDSFLTKGVKHFADAYYTLEAFKDGLRDKLEPILREPRWQVWRPDPTIKVSKTFSTSGGLWVGAGTKGHLDGGEEEPIGLDTAVWWQPEAVPGESVVFCTAFWGGPPALTKELSTSPIGGNVRSARRHGTTYLYVVPQLEHRKLEDDFRELLDALEQCVRASVSES